MTNDPMLKTSEHAARVLFGQFSKSANGFATEAVIGAAINLLINGIRQTQPTRQQAEVRFNDLFGQAKQILMDHYDSMGRKKGIFPYTQTIHGQLFNPKDEFGGKH